MRTPLILLLLTGCSWFDEPTPSSLYACRGEPVNGDHTRVSIPTNGAAIVVPNADDWRSDCSRSVDPDGSAQLMSLSSESQRSSAYI